MNTLYLSYDGLTDPLGQSQILPYVIGLSKKGWKMSIISFEKKDRFERHSEEIKTICSLHQIDWNPQFYTKKPPIISTLRDLRKMRSTVRKICEDKNIKLLHCRSYLPMLIALALQQKGIKVLFDMRGFWVDERVEGRIWDIKNPLFKGIYAYFKKQEQRFLHDADAIVSLTDAAIPLLIKMGAKASITRIPTSVDLALFDPKNIDQNLKSELSAKLNLNEKFVLGYSGSLGTWYLLDEMLLFFKKLKEEKSNTHLLIISHDDNKLVFNKAFKLGIKKEDISILSATRNEMPLYLSLFDLSLMFIKASFSKKASSPTKLGELMAMGVPVICNSGVGDVENIVTKYNAGIVIAQPEANSFKRALEIIKNDDFYSIESMEKGAKEYYDLTKGVKIYDDIYRSLI